MTGVGYDDDPESSQQRFGNFSEFDDLNDRHDVTTTLKGQDTTAIDERTNSVVDGQVRVNGMSVKMPELDVCEGFGRTHPGQQSLQSGSGQRQTRLTSPTHT